MSEHIVLQSDERRVPDSSAPRRIHARFTLHSSLRRHTLELCLMDYYFLGVRNSRGRGADSEYILDLRHIDPQLRAVRHIAWRWLHVTLALTALFAATIWYIASSTGHWSTHHWTPGVAALLGAGIGAGFIATYRTTETLMIYSALGQAKILQFTGAIGTFRRARPFIARLTAHLHMAVRNKSPKTEQLRHEMREHFRLREMGVLSEQEYEASKRRILQQHG